MNVKSRGTNLERWDLVIKPSASIFDINLKELWKYRDLIVLFVKRDFVATYKQTILGPLWHLAQPIFTTLMYLLIFSKMAGIPTEGVPPILFYLCGVAFWNYFSNCLLGASNTFVNNAGIFGKVYFPRLVSPISIIISNLIGLGIQFFLFLLVFAYYGFKGEVHCLSVNLLLLFPLLLVLAGIALGLGIIISSMTTKYRDLRILMGFGIPLLVYATPVVYPLSFLLGKSYKWIALLNPISSLMEGFRFALFNTGSLSLPLLTYSFCFMAASILIGVVIFNKVERSFMDTV